MVPTKLDHLNTFTMHSLRTGYKSLCEAIISNGEETAPRGMKTKELLGAKLIIADPVDSLPLGIGRKLNAAIGAVEAIQLIGGFSDVELTTRIAPNMKAFTDDALFHGAYGPRAGWQYHHVVRRLRSDQDSRQAVVNIWDSRSDVVRDGLHDYPCTLTLHFMLRRDRLNLHVNMRSNDVWWGLAYDVFQFTQLQLSLAAQLGVEAGTYFHVSNSLHMYERDFDAVAALTDGRGPLTEPAWPRGISGESVADMQTRAYIIAHHAKHGISPLPFTPTRHEEWYYNRLCKQPARETTDG